ncbi:MAG: 2'-deoxycytidine 5'-triphosphate deaminase [Actinobacteria bacterium QS_5_72_10]|nr:MAG: 2'-deoxycytidine 5'-triphosphate deaminase [Actinobacteria bacterium QS_5_72_10]
MPPVPSQPGVLPSQYLHRFIEAGLIDAGEFKIPPENVQPASLDLRLARYAYRIRCSFLPGPFPIGTKLRDLIVDCLDIQDGAVLETNRPYLIPLLETVRLPAGVRGKANPKSSTGRLDVFTRVITDSGHRFDEIPAGYEGPLYLEVVPLSFTVKVRQGLSLNQLRLQTGATALTDAEISQRHADDGIVYRAGAPLDQSRLSIDGGVFLGVDLKGHNGRVGYRAKDYTPLLDMDARGELDVAAFWESVHSEAGDRIVLAPERFYLLLSQDAVRVPPDLAGEMTAFDPTSGELRTHYAGFFDPGFGYDTRDGPVGSRAALEVRAHDVPFMIEHGQRVCRLTFERMVEPPELLYGEAAGSAYQHQEHTLSKHFPGPDGNRTDRPAARYGLGSSQGHPSLFGDAPDEPPSS